MTLDDFLPTILPRAKGCPAPIAKQQLRFAIIELCRKALLWREYQPSIAAVALQTSYAYTPAADQKVSKLLSLTAGGLDIGLVTPEKGKVLDALGNLDNYAYGGLKGFEIRPAQAAGVPIITYSAVEPSTTATTVPDDFARYLEALSFGTLYRLYAAPDLECHNGGSATSMLGMWNDAMNKAAGDVITGFSRATPRTSPSWF